MFPRKAMAYVSTTVSSGGVGVSKDMNTNEVGHNQWEMFPKLAWKIRKWNTAILGKTKPKIPKTKTHFQNVIFLNRQMKRWDDILVPSLMILAADAASVRRCSKGNWLPETSHLETLSVNIGFHFTSREHPVALSC